MTVLVTTMLDGVQVIPKLTTFANLTVDVKPAIWTKRSKVMHYLHNRHIQRMQCVIQRRRNKGIDIVNESYVWCEILNRLSDLPLGAMRIHSARDERGFLPQRIALDLVVVPGEGQYLVPIALEEISFRDGCRIFSAELLVEVVNKKNLH